MNPRNLLPPVDAQNILRMAYVLNGTPATEILSDPDEMDRLQTRFYAMMNEAVKAKFRTLRLKAALEADLQAKNIPGLVSRELDEFVVSQ